MDSSGSCDRRQASPVSAWSCGRTALISCVIQNRAGKLAGLEEGQPVSLAPSQPFHQRGLLPHVCSPGPGPRVESTPGSCETWLLPFTKWAPKQPHPRFAFPNNLLPRGSESDGVYSHSHATATALNLLSVLFRNYLEELVYKSHIHTHPAVDTKKRVLFFYAGASLLLKITFPSLITHLIHWTWLKCFLTLSPEGGNFSTTEDFQQNVPQAVRIFPGWGGLKGFYMVG